MEVKHFKSFPKRPNYFIEWGNATWTHGQPLKNKDWSIRNRYNKADGGYNHIGSKEIPWDDFKKMIAESVTEKQFTKRELTSILLLIVKQFIKQFLNK